MNNLSRKSRVFKSTIAYIMSLFIVLSSVISTPFFVKAASTSLTITKYGTIHSGSNTRYSTSGSNPVLNIVNDQEDDNFDIGFLRLDISSLDNTKKVGYTPFTFSTTSISAEPQGLTFYCSTNDKLSSLNTGANNLNGNTGIFGTVGGHLNKAISYYQMAEFASIAKGSIASNKSYTVDIAEAINNALLQKQSTCTIMITQTTAGGKGSSNDWTDTPITFSPYSISATTTSEALTIDNWTAEFNTATKAYETKMADSNIYKNMYDAYTAYTNVYKAYDAYVYGEKYDINLSYYVQALTRANNNMIKWSRPNSFTVPKFSDGEITSSSNATGCIWAESNGDPLVYRTTGSNNTVYSLYYHEGVYIYDDQEPKIPFILGFYRYAQLGNPANPRVWFATLDNSQGNLYIKNQLYNGDASNRLFSELMSKGYHINSNNNGSANNITLSTGDVRYLANYFVVNTSAAFSTNTTGYIVAYPTQITYGVGNASSSSAFKTEYHVLGDNRKFYILNYNLVSSKITNPIYANYFKYVSKYKEGGLDQLIKAFDIATSINPLNYNYSLSNNKTAATNCGAAIVNASNNITNAGEPALDTSSYNSIKTALTTAKEIGNTNQELSTANISTTKYTSASFANYQNCVNEAKNAMQAVLQNGYASIYNGKSIAAISSNLTSSISNLKYNYIVEYYNKEAQYIGSEVLGEGEFTSVDKYPNSSITAGTDGFRKHYTYSWYAIELKRKTFGENQVVAITEEATATPCTIINSIVTKEPSCGVAGEKEGICAICKATYVDEIETTPHSYEVTIVPATCTQQGYALHKCTECGNEYKDSYTAIISHSYEDTIVKATCTEDGYTSKRCSSCGEEIIEESSIIKAYGHSYECDVILAPSCNAQGIKEYYCARCKDTYHEAIPVDVSAHNELAFARTVAPTDTEQGYDIYYCTNLCGYWEKKNIIPSLKETSELEEYINAYNYALEQIVTDFAPYTSESIEAYQNAIDNAKIDIENSNTSQLENATRQILEASAILRIKTVTINIRYNRENGATTKNKISAQYGNIVTTSLDNENVIKWTITQNGVTSIASYDNVCNVVAGDDMEIDAIIGDEKKNNDNIITVLDKNGNAIAFTNDITTVTAPSVPFYNFSHWEQINDTTYQARYVAK